MALGSDKRALVGLVVRQAAVSGSAGNRGWPSDGIACVALGERVFLTRLRAWIHGAWPAASS